METRLGIAIGVFPSAGLCKPMTETWPNEGGTPQGETMK